MAMDPLALDKQTSLHSKAYNILYIPKYLLRNDSITMRKHDW